MKQFLKFAYSLQGANHKRDGKVCQDASRAYENGSMAVIAVADGHGSDNYPRTDRGSRFAVTAALEAIKEFVKAVRREAPLDAINVFAEQKDRLRGLELNILRRWHESVDGDIEENPFCECELEKVSQRYREAYLDPSNPRRKKAYGTTLIAICAIEDYWFGLQIGDGKCFAIGWDGVCTEPIPWDENCQANITTSICDENALEEFRFFCGEEFPLAVFIASDGVDDSYAGDDELHDLYRTIFCMLDEKGEKAGTREIQQFLPVISKNGSGDDVSMAGLIRKGVQQKTVDLVLRRKELSTARCEEQRLSRAAAVAKEKRDHLQGAVPGTGEEGLLRRFEAEYEGLLEQLREAQTTLKEAQCRLDEVPLHGTLLKPAERISPPEKAGEGKSRNGPGGRKSDPIRYEKK